MLKFRSCTAEMLVVDNNICKTKLNHNDGGDPRGLNHIHIRWRNVEQATLGIDTSVVHMNTPIYAMIDPGVLQGSHTWGHLDNNVEQVI